MVVYPSLLSQTGTPPRASQFVYAPDALPPLPDHYWLARKPVHPLGNALCLDYSAGKDTPHVSYHFDPDRPELVLSKIEGFEQ